jgi:phage shock protein PspC (stress-responsive transcriptional regulator)|tara:strand:- start:711 stop:884 length:174 start_codon:yes stop_codon:yes gene_type:complete
MGSKGIFLAFLIVCAIYFWRRYRSKVQGKSAVWVNWVLGGIAIYYGISIILIIISSI